MLAGSLRALAGEEGSPESSSLKRCTGTRSQHTSLVCPQTRTQQSYERGHRGREKRGRRNRGWKAQQGVVTWIWAQRSHLHSPDLGKQQPSILCNTALLPGLQEGQEERLLREGTLPPNWGGKKTCALPSWHQQPRQEGQGSLGKGEDAAPCVWTRQFCVDCLQAGAAGGVELSSVQPYNVPTNEALTRQAGTQPRGCSPAQARGFTQKGSLAGVLPI